MPHEKDVLARYGISDHCATPSEYAAIEGIESSDADGDIRKLCDEIRFCIGEAMTESAFKSRNPWFTNRQMGIIEAFMGGGFAFELLTSRSDPARTLASCDELLARMVAACDPAFENHEERLGKILEEAAHPDPDAIQKRFEPLPDDDEVLASVSFTRRQIREMLGDPEIPDDLLKRFALRLEDAMIGAASDISPEAEIARLRNGLNPEI